jgi:signal transduction histidine kinase/CheY-like chemotaxis protein
MTLRSPVRSLAAKWMLYHVVGLTIVLSIVGVLLQHQLQRHARGNVQRTAENVANVLRESLAVHPDLFDARQMQPIVTRLAATIPNVARISAVSPDGYIIADSDVQQIGRQSEGVASLAILLQNGVEQAHYATSDEQFVRLTFPVEGPYDRARMSATLGALVLDMRLSLANAEVTRVLVTAMLTFSVLLVGFWAGKHLLVNRPFARSLARVSSAASQLGAGDLSVRLPVTSRDEVGALALAFNHMADAIQQTHGELTAEVERRGVVEAELARARDAAVDSARLKAEFVANMSHEIRTPMNGIIGMTSLLLDSSLTAEQTEFTDTIRHSGDALLTIINDILDFSKIDAGKLVFENVDFDITHAVEGTLDLLAETAFAKGIEIGAHIEAGVPRFLRGDPGRFRQVLTNLVGNAVKFTSQGEVFVHVTALPRIDGRIQLRVSVRDTGIGLSDEARRRLFRPFTQADGSTTRNYGGTGLGLAISKRLAEGMNGEIGVDSTQGVGSTFWFTSSFDEQPAAVDRGSLELALDKCNVLIVDDHALTRTVLQHQLHAWGVACDTVSSGQSALEKLLSAAEGPCPFTVALVDRDMPEMDGVLLARRISEDRRLSSMRVVLMTPPQYRGEASLLQEAGVAARLPKPVKQSQLLDCLMKLLDHGNVTMSAATRLAVPREPAGLERRPPLKTGRVLVAEDNVVNLKLAVHLFRRLGYEADTAVNGLEAVSAVARVPYDCVFMDCQMPEMDGFEATAAIRRAEAGRRHTVIIAMTANAMAGDREACIDAGMDDYVAKPVKLEGVREALARWMPIRTGTEVDCTALASLRTA